MKNQTPKAIPTVYRGIEFRSRFEASFAQLLDQVRINFEYEPKSFLLPNGQHYMPDFWLPESETWVETRGYESAAGESQLTGFAQQLVQTRTAHVFTVVRWDAPARVFVPWMDAGGFLPAALHYCYVCRRWSIGPWYMPLPCRDCERWLAYGDFAVYTVGIVGKQGKLTNGNDILISDRIGPVEKAYKDTQEPLGEGGPRDFDPLPILRQRGVLPEAVAFLQREQWEDLPPPVEQFVKQGKQKGAAKP